MEFQYMKNLQMLIKCQNLKYIIINIFVGIVL